VTVSRAWLWAPAVLWAGVIFTLSAIPSLGTGLGVWDLLLRKLAHATEYGILAVLIERASRRYDVALVAASAYAVTDELHQHFVGGRHAAPTDWAIDTAGALIGLIALRRWRARR
jgi:VanZ family protein